MHILSVQPPRSANRRRTWTCCCRPGTGNDSCFRARPTCVQDNGGRPLGLIAATRSNEFPVVIGGGGGAGEGGARGRGGGCQQSSPLPRFDHSKKLPAPRPNPTKCAPTHRNGPPTPPKCAPTHRNPSADSPNTRRPTLKMRANPPKCAPSHQKT